MQTVQHLPLKFTSSQSSLCNYKDEKKIVFALFPFYNCVQLTTYKYTS